jgi:hypothetical protein
MSTYAQSLTCRLCACLLFGVGWGSGSWSVGYISNFVVMMAFQNFGTLWLGSALCLESREGGESATGNSRDTEARYRMDWTGQNLGGSDCFLRTPLQGLPESEFICRYLR